jgi:ketosteroid isomerase-like protein
MLAVTRDSAAHRQRFQTDLKEGKMVTARNPNEQVVLDFFAGLNNGDLDVVRAQLAPDIKWRPMVTGVAGYDAETIFTDLLAYLRGIFAPGDPQQAVGLVVSTGDTVVVETRCTGAVPSKDNGVYENDYCWVLEMHDGKIRTIREYLDIDKIRAFFA